MSPFKLFSIPLLNTKKPNKSNYCDGCGWLRYALFHSVKRNRFLSNKTKKTNTTNLHSTEMSVQNEVSLSAKLTQWHMKPLRWKICLSSIMRNDDVCRFAVFCVERFMPGYFFCIMLLIFSVYSRVHIFSVWSAPVKAEREYSLEPISYKRKKNLVDLFINFIWNQINWILQTFPFRMLQPK